MRAALVTISTRRLCEHMLTETAWEHLGLDEIIERRGAPRFWDSPAIAFSLAEVAAAFLA